MLVVGSVANVPLKEKELALVAENRKFWKTHYRIAAAFNVAAFFIIPLEIMLFLYLPEPLAKSTVIFAFLCILPPAIPMLFFAYKMQIMLCPACGHQFHNSQLKDWFRKQTHCAHCGIKIGELPHTT